MPNLNAPGTRVTPIPKGVAARVGEAVRYVISGVTPATWFGPMQPLAPMAPDGTAGRAFDKVMAWALRIAAGVLLLGASGGALFKALFDH